MSDREVAAMASMTEAHELLLIEEADAWFEYLEATRGQSALRYADLEPRSSGDRCATNSTPEIAVIRRTSLARFIVSSGRSAPGTKTAAPTIAFRRANDSTRLSYTTSRNTGSRAASGVAASPNR